VLIVNFKFPFSWDDSRLREKFRSAGFITLIEIKAKGQAVIGFNGPDEAKRAVGK
jgi:hypothetical protein